MHIHANHMQIAPPPDQLEENVSSFLPPGPSEGGSFMGQDGLCPGGSHVRRGNRGQREGRTGQAPWRGWAERGRAAPPPPPVPRGSPLQMRGRRCWETATFSLKFTPKGHSHQHSPRTTASFPNRSLCQSRRTCCPAVPLRPGPGARGPQSAPGNGRTHAALRPPPAPGPAPPLPLQPVGSRQRRWHPLGPDHESAGSPAPTRGDRHGGARLPGRRESDLCKSERNRGVSPTELSRRGWWERGAGLRGEVANPEAPGQMEGGGRRQGAGRAQELGHTERLRPSLETEAHSAELTDTHSWGQRCRSCHASATEAAVGALPAPGPCSSARGAAGSSRPRQWAVPQPTAAQWPWQVWDPRVI